MSEASVAHAHSSKHQGKDKGPYFGKNVTLTPEEYRSLLRRLASGKADVYWDDGHLIYLLTTDNPDFLIKVVASPFDKEVGHMDAIINAFRIYSGASESLRDKLIKRGW